MKISGSYASLLRGVSQQSPEVRQPGQHGEQVNLLSDPVQGLTRRRGSIRQASMPLPIPTADYVAILAKGTGYRVHEHTSLENEYVFYIREATPELAYESGNAAYSPAIICYNRTTKAFIPLNVDGQTAAADILIGRNGIAAVASVGKLLCFAINGYRVNTVTTAQWNIPANNKLIFWVRGGAYSRTYKITLDDGQTFSHTTPDAAAPGAAAAISPENIVLALNALLTAAGIGVAREGAHMYADTLQNATFTDGGDGSLVRACYNIVDDVSKLPILAVQGMVVKIVTGPDTAYYVKADTVGGNPYLNAATWVETSGTLQGDDVTNFFVGVIESGTLRLAQAPDLLLGTDIPQFVASTSGDAISNPPPAFMAGRLITFMGMFQDRLVVAAGAAVAVSAAGDYFNFFRSSVVTVPLKDGFEMIAQGGEDDVIHYGVAYSRNLVLFGEKRQYLISGQQALTPTSANMSVMTTYSEAAQVSPVSAGGQIYYGRNREGAVGLHQIQPGAYVDSAESFPASAQISTYIKAPAAQILAVAGAPAQIMVRSRSVVNEVYVFSYLDQPDGRKQDAWNRWVFAPQCGTLLGISNTSDGILLMWLRRRTSDGALAIVADLLPMSTYVGEYPYFDSARSWQAV